MRLLRVEKQIKDIVANILIQEINNPKIGMVTITQVKVSPDLQHAKVFYSHIGSQEQQKVAHFALKSAASYVTKRLGNILTTKHIPRIRFIFDASLLKLDKIGSLLNEIEDEQQL